MKSITTLVIVGIVGILFFVGCNGYNRLVKQEESVKRAWNNVETEYQKRNDLVGNLVNTVKGAADFEQSTLTAVVEARANATQMNINADELTPENIARFQQAQNQLSGALSRLLATVEAYPTLRATEGFMQLQRQLEGIENDIKNSRRAFNAEIQTYNTRVRTFPGNLISGLFGFKQKEGFAADEGAERAPEVKF